MIATLLMLASLARLGPFSEWTQTSYVLILITLAFMAPVIVAVVRLRD